MIGTEHTGFKDDTGEEEDDDNVEDKSDQECYKGTCATQDQLFLTLTLLPVLRSPITRQDPLNATVLFKLSDHKTKEAHHTFLLSSAAESAFEEFCLEN